MPPDAPTPGDVESFAASVGLDERATQALSELEPQSQCIVMHLVKQQPCRNPSAVTWSKVKAIRDTPLQVKAEYLRQELDDPSYEALSKLPVHVQELVVSEVDILRSRNVSAVVWAKMRQLGVSRSTGDPQGGKKGQDTYGEVAGSVVEDKLAILNLDEKAQEALAKLTRADQREVLSHVNPEACRNPSAVVIARIQDLRKNSLPPSAGRPGSMPNLPALPPPPRAPGGFAGGGQGGARDRSRTPAPPNSVNQAIALQVLRSVSAVQGRNAGVTATAVANLGALSTQANLDHKAQRAVSELDPQEQHIVMSLVAQENCKNPSAVAWSKVKKVRENPSEVKMEFLLKAIDENAAKSLQELPVDVQEMIVGDVDVTKCRNLSAVIWSKVKAAAGGDVQALQDRPRPSAPSRAPRGGGLGEVGTGGPLQLDDRAREALESLGADDQIRIINEVEAQPGLNNPSAFVWSKVKKIRDGVA